MNVLFEIQRELEEQGRVSGQKRYEDRMDKDEKKGRYDGTHYGVELIEKEFPKMVEAFDLALNPKDKRKQPQPAKLVESWISPQALALITLKLVVGKIGADVSLTQIANLIGSALEVEVLKETQSDEGKKHLNSLLNKMKGDTRQERLNASKYINEKYGSLHIQWSKKDILNVGVFCVHVLDKHSDWVELVEQEDRKSTTKVVPTAAMTAKIKEKRKEREFLSPIYQPMVVKPRDWHAGNVKNGCYLTDAQAPISFVKRLTKKHRRMIQKFNPTNVFESVNVIQGTAWKIRKPVLELLQTLIEHKENLSMSSKKFAPQQNIVMSDDMDFRARKKAKKKNSEYETVRMVMNTNLATAEQFKDFDKIYIPHQLDTRGRVYPVPALNPQGADYIKALLEFAEGKPLGKDGLFWLKIHAANTFGMDKLTFQRRIKWVDENLSDIYASALDPLKNRLWSLADKPFLFYATCCELLGAGIQGESFVSHMPINFDGSCSGLQHLGAAFRCVTTAKVVNLLSTPNKLSTPEDIYQDVADDVSEILKESDSPYAKLWLEMYDGRLSRSVAKRCVMTYPYGSSVNGFKHQLLADIIKPAIEDGTLIPLPDDNDGFLMATYLAPIMETVIKSRVVKAAEAMKWMQETMSLACQEGKAVYWVTPLGFPVVQEYFKNETDRVDLTLDGQRYQVAFSKSGRSIDKRKMRSSVSPNVVHSLDSTHLMMAVLKANQEHELKDFSLIHDSFGTHAADSQEFFMIIRETFIELYSQPVFENLKDTFDAQMSEKVKPKAPLLPSKGGYNLEEIKESLFAFA